MVWMIKFHCGIAIFRIMNVFYFKFLEMYNANTQIENYQKQNLLFSIL